MICYTRLNYPLPVYIVGLFLLALMASHFTSDNPLKDSLILSIDLSLLQTLHAAPCSRHC